MNTPRLFLAITLLTALFVGDTTRGYTDEPPQPTVVGHWTTTTDVAFERYHENWDFADASGGLLALAVAAAADAELDDSEFLARLFELIEDSLDPAPDVDGPSIGMGELPGVLDGKFANKTVNRLRDALLAADPILLTGTYDYFDDFYPNVSLRGHTLVVKVGYRFVGIYREKEVHENINDAGDTAVERLYGLVEVKLAKNEAFFFARGLPLSQNGFQWKDTCVADGVVPTEKKVKKALKKRKGFTCEIPHGLESPLYSETSDP